MPAPSISKIALHFSRVAANNAAAGIRSALHAGNSAAASAGINAGGATAAAAAGGAGIGLGAAAASASGASAGASAAGGKTWGAYTYYQTAGQRTLVNLTPGSSDNANTHTEDDDDDQPSQRHSHKILSGAGPPTPAQASAPASPVSVSRHGGSVAQVGLRASPGSLRRVPPSTSVTSEAPSAPTSAEAAPATDSSSSQSSPPLALLSQWEQQYPVAAARLHAHARLRRAYKAMYSPQLITSASPATDSTSATSLPAHMLPLTPTAGPLSIQSAPFSTTAHSERQSAGSEAAQSDLDAKTSRPRAPFNAMRLRSLSFGGATQANGFHSSAVELSEPTSSQVASDVAAVDMPGLPPVHADQSGPRRPQRRNSFSGPSTRRNPEDMQPGLRDASARPFKRMRHETQGEASLDENALHNILHSKLRAFAYWRQRSSAGSQRGKNRGSLAGPPRNSVKATVHEYLTKVPQADQSVSGWNACLEALYAARCYNRSGVSSDAASTVADADAASSIAAAAQEGGEAAAVEQAAPIADAPDASLADLNVLDVYRLMTDAGFQATGRTYTIVVQALCAHYRKVRQEYLEQQQGSSTQQSRTQTAVETEDIEPISDRAQIAAVLDSLLSRALELLRTAVGQHPRMVTHPISKAPYMALIDSYMEQGRPDQVEAVIELWKHSTTEARYFKLDSRPYARLIAAQVVAARAIFKQVAAEAAESGLSEAALESLAKERAETFALALEGAQQVISQFETDLKAGLVETSAGDRTFVPTEEDNGDEDTSASTGTTIDQFLPLYNAVIRAAFTLEQPDRGLELLEELLARQEAEFHAAGGSGSVPMHGSTLTCLVRAFLSIDEPLTAVKWLLKVRGNGSTDSNAIETGTGAVPIRKIPLLTHLLYVLTTKVPNQSRWDSEKAKIDPIMDGISSVLKIIKAQFGLRRVRAEHMGAVARAEEFLSKYTRHSLETESRQATLQNKPWESSASLLPPSPPNASDALPDQATPGTLLNDTITPPPSPPQSAESTPATLEETALASPLQGMPGPAPGLPPVEIVDVDLGKEIESLIRPQRVNGQQIFIDVDSALALVRNKVALGEYPAPESLGLLMMAFGRQGDLERANEIYAVATTAIGALGGDPVWQARAWHLVEDNSLCALAHAGELNAAIEYRHRIIGAGRVPSADAYASLIATVKDTTDDALVAEELFDESQRLGVRPNVYLYTTVISKLSRARRTARALQLFEEMQAQQLRPSTVTFGAVINACVRSGDREGALRYFEQMEADPGFKARVPPYNSMMQFFIYTQPDREQALNFYNKMRAHGVWPSSHTYKLLLDVHGSIEPVQPAEMDRVFQQLKVDKRLSVLGTHWASLIQCYGAKCKDVNKAIEIFKSSIQDATPDPIAFEALLNVFVELNRADLLRQHVQWAESAGLRLTAYVCNVLIKGLAQEGPVGLVEARTIFDQMQDPPAGLAATGNHAARSHGAGAVPQVDPAPTASPTTATPSGQIGSFGGSTMSSFAQVSKEPSTYESMIRAELSHGNVVMAEALLERMESRGFPPALILRTRGLLDIPQDRVLTANLVASAGTATAGSGSAEAAE